MDYSKLRARIDKKYGNAAIFADAIETDQNTVNDILSDKVELSMDDIIKWSGVLDIPQDDIRAYFLTMK